MMTVSLSYHVLQEYHSRIKVTGGATVGPNRAHLMRQVRTEVI